MPQHVAIVMDGNGRWARRQQLPRLNGHAAGVPALRRCVAACLERGIRYLTVFAFSSENWRRPQEEVAGLMSLFVQAMQSQLADLHSSGVRLRFVGERSGLPPDVVGTITSSEALTTDNTALTLIIALNYGGRWDIVQAAKNVVAQGQELTEATLERALDTAFAPAPDLLIRTGGEQRLSNFLLWQAAYAELYFTERLWPDFTATDLDEAIGDYAGRERRFGAVPLEQVA